MPLNNDPRTMQSRFRSKCSGCNSTIIKGSEIIYAPAARKAYGTVCCDKGPQIMRDFEASVFDEAQFNGSW